jgi:hypothetical protein
MSNTYHAVQFEKGAVTHVDLNDQRVRANVRFRRAQPTTAQMRKQWAAARKQQHAGGQR